MKTATSSGERERPKVISYLNLRNTVGILGILLPVIMIGGSFIFGDCKEVQKSISAYYHTNMRNVFVGTISTIALFLFAYKGYNKTDARAGNLGGIFALGGSSGHPGLSRERPYLLTLNPKLLVTHKLTQHETHSKRAVCYRHCAYSSHIYHTGFSWT